MKPLFLSLLCLGAMLGVPASVSCEESQSSLWGAAGERWSPKSRLPDFSFAGYQRGEAPIPTPPVTHNIRDFGAVGDGVHDDSDAFLSAIDSMKQGVLLIPAGRYLVTKQIVLNKSNLILRGEGPEKTVIYCPKPLNDIKPNWGATTGGRRTSNYSWSGGMFEIRGDFQRAALTAITGSAVRGDNTLVVEDSAGLQVGQEIEIQLKDDEVRSLAEHLYSDDLRVGIENLKQSTTASLVTRITKIDGMTISFDRPLRFDIRASWVPTVKQFAPTVTESGIESMGFSFPNTPYEGHFTELGHNVFALYGVAHCWVRDIHIHNADSGVMLSGIFNTLTGIRYTSERSKDSNRASTGHHGVYVGGDDNLVTKFDFQTVFIHDLTVSRTAGNVFSDGRGEDLSLDHHCRAPYENLFTNIDVGSATRVWLSGGGQLLGAHCGARGTFWNIRGDKPIPTPSKNFGPWSMNLVGVAMGIGDVMEADARWIEHGKTGSVTPGDIHEAQRRKRLQLAP